MRTEDLPSYTPQGRAEVPEGEIAYHGTNPTPRGRTDSTPEDEARDRPDEDQ